MELLDDDGNLFGVVNVVDALVVLFVLAVVAAGAAFVLQPDPEPAPEPELATTNATLDLGTQPSYIVEEIEAGDTYSPAGNTDLRITDVHLTPQNGDTRVILGVNLRGTVSGDTIDYNGAPPRVGRSLTIQTSIYQVSGTLRDLGSGPETTTTDVVVEDTVSTETATAIQTGDTYTLGGTDIATVESVTAYGTDNPDRKRVLVGLSLATLQDDGDVRFGGTTVREGTTIPFQTSEYSLTGSIQRVGATNPQGETATRTMTLQLEDVPPAKADSIHTGLTETVRGTTIADITDVDREAATVILTSRDGNIYERNHPVNQDLTLTADLTIRETATGVTFKGRTIQQGSNVTLDLGTTTVHATVVST
ncbi:DUF4330 family protein [Halobacterium noricense]|uniref:DUF4330 family protein n=1 Tax=Halobacterium noricense TaxID=223182 RepID=UPI001E391574|nr:DUF4330 family protein [Halobacterium noricense]UHH26584.1 DUF4330 domain-containing protein [Halobacterium noricense]